MTVDIHPEDLIDKLTDGEITPDEEARLRAHLSRCASCRFELSVRADFLAEIPAIGERPHFGLGASLAGAAREPKVNVARAPRRRRVAFLLVAAALVLCAGGAAAVTGAGARVLPWAFRAASNGVLEHASANSVAKAKLAHTAAPAPTSAKANDVPEPVANPESELVNGEPASSVSVAAPAALPAKATPSTATPSIVAPNALAPVTPAPLVTNAVNAPATIDFAAAVGSAAPSMASAVPDAPPVAEDAASVFSEANRARRDGNAERAELLYRSLQARFPGSAESELSREVLAQMLLERGNAAQALSGFDRYLAGGSSGLAAEAMVGRARALEQLGQRTQAAAAWHEVLRRYPGSVHARLAAARLASLDPE